MSLKDLQELINQAQEVIQKEISNLPKEEQSKVRDLQEWTKTASMEEVQKKLIKLKEDAK